MSSDVERFLAGNGPLADMLRRALPAYEPGPAVAERFQALLQQLAAAGSPVEELMFSPPSSLEAAFNQAAAQVQAAQQGRRDAVLQQVAAGQDDVAVLGASVGAATHAWLAAQQPAAAERRAPRARARSPWLLFGGAMAAMVLLGVMVVPLMMRSGSHETLAQASASAPEVAMAPAPASVAASAPAASAPVAPVLVAANAPPPVSNGAAVVAKPESVFKSAHAARTPVLEDSRSVAASAPVAAAPVAASAATPLAVRAEIPTAASQGASLLADADTRAASPSAKMAAAAPVAAAAMPEHYAPAPTAGAMVERTAGGRGRYSLGMDPVLLARALRQRQGLIVVHQPDNDGARAWVARLQAALSAQGQASKVLVDSELPADQIRIDRQ